MLAYVELEEGPRVMTNVVDCDPDTVHIGQAVEVTFHDTGQGSALPRFRPRPRRPPRRAQLVSWAMPTAGTSRASSAMSSTAAGEPLTTLTPVTPDSAQAT